MQLKENLPVQLTSFIGREREITNLKGLLFSYRLVTLLGAGARGRPHPLKHAALIQTG